MVTLKETGKIKTVYGTFKLQFPVHFHDTYLYAIALYVVTFISLLKRLGPYLSRLAGLSVCL